MRLRLLDAGWAAGFIEGEGSFLFNCSPRVAAGQIQREPLERLQALFGGSITQTRVTSGGHLFHEWRVHGRRSIEIMFTLYTLMSPKRRRQIEAVVARWKKMPGRGAPGVPRPYAAALAANARSHLTHGRSIS